MFMPTKSRNGNPNCSRALEIFATQAEKIERGPNVKDLHAKIGQLTLENDFLESALGRIEGASAKR